jgi:hypothetical protein
MIKPEVEGPLVDSGGRQFLCSRHDEAIEFNNLPNSSGLKWALRFIQPLTEMSFRDRNKNWK